jgi:hypothetical protein
MKNEIAKRLFTVHDYQKMLDAGILHEDDRVELIRGEVIQMSPINPLHNGTIHRANWFLSRIIGDRAIIGVQGSIRLNEYDEPQPDLYLLRPKEDFYTSRHAGPAEILLIIEVADTSSITIAPRRCNSMPKRAFRNTGFQTFNMTALSPIQMRKARRIALFGRSSAGRSFPRSYCRTAPSPSMLYFPERCFAESRH